MEGDKLVVAIVGRLIVYDGSNWDFKLDKSRMGRCIDLKGIHQLSDLQDLKDRYCSCLEFQKLNIPCRHAMAAAHVRGLDYKTLVGIKHQVTSWSATVVGMILPVKDPAECVVPVDVRVMCLMRLTTNRQPGRPPKLCIPSNGEFEVNGNSQQPNKCGRCRGYGHNKTTCSAPLN